ncbi:hypothetical protein SKAU_G00080260 [Synaphobranchus kaupii]|uniref:Uncharacterized protein n=1 Tax=Synaphobranchus kaupii TaxID=118154 RepID=A0A9Q1J5I8_SYNKA|nr:hypothetical protein SKAU_G00080260 [Synaphobranchus kaupii]
MGQGWRTGTVLRGASQQDLDMFHHPALRAHGGLTPRPADVSCGGGSVAGPSQLRTQTAEFCTACGLYKPGSAALSSQCPEQPVTGRYICTDEFPRLKTRSSTPPPASPFAPVPTPWAITGLIFGGHLASPAHPPPPHLIHFSFHRKVELGPEVVSEHFPHSAAIFTCQLAAGAARLTAAAKITPSPCRRRVRLFVIRRT